jgi:uncharacterized protein with von Willebrand factor type A (vWA) domain
VIEIAKKVGRRDRTKDLRLELAMDIFYSMYLPYPLILPPSEIPSEMETHYYIIKALITADEAVELRRHSIADSTLSTLLSASLADHILKELSEETGGKNKEGSGGGTDSKSVMNAVRRAMNNVSNEMAYIKELRKLLGRGEEPGRGSRMDLLEDGSEIIKLARAAEIQELLDYLTLVPDVGRTVKKRYVRFNHGEFRGYELGDVLERVVPTELASPRIYFLVKLLESRLLLYEKVLPKVHGPIYLLTDKSGSMDGDKIKWAKATAIALLTKARKEQRAFYLRFFDSSPHTLIKISKRPKPREVIETVKYVARVAGSGGTDISKAVLTACDDIKSSSVRGASDIVLITDGEDSISVNYIAKKVRDANARLITVMIMGENRDLRDISEAYLRVVKLSKDEILKVVEA